MLGPQLGRHFTNMASNSDTVFSVQMFIPIL